MPVVSLGRMVDIVGKMYVCVCVCGVAEKVVGWLVCTASVKRADAGQRVRYAMKMR